MAVVTPLFLHTKTLDAIDLRRAALDGGLQPGVVGSGDYVVAQTGVASMNLTVAAGAAWVAGSTTARQGLYDVYNDAAVTVAIGANASGNARLDQIILRVYDSADGAQGQDIGVIEVLPGSTAVGGATLANRTGAAALPVSCIRLADVLVASGAASIANAVIRDRRPWARGGFTQVFGSTANPTATSVATPGTLISDMTATLECTGTPVRVSYFANLTHSVANTAVVLMPQVDGGAPTGYAADDLVTTDVITATLVGTTLFGFFTFTPTAGRHVFTLNMWGGAAGTTTASAKRRALSVEELVRTNQGNALAGYG